PPPAEEKRLAEAGSLQHFALRVEDALVAVPLLPVADEPCGSVRNAAVQAERLGRLWRVVVLLSSVLGHEQGVVESAGGEKTAAEVAEGANALGPVEPRARQPRCGVPRERPPAVPPP